MQSLDLSFVCAVDWLLKSLFSHDNLKKSDSLLNKPQNNQDKQMEHSFPQCLKCNKGVLLPLSDYGREGSSIRYKAWVCNNPDCGYNLRIDNGEISRGYEIKQTTK